MSFRTVLGLIVFAAFLVGVVVYSEKRVQRTPEGDRTTVIYWEKWTGSEEEEMRKTVNDFNTSQDKIFVRYLSISDVANKTLLATAGGDPPDVAGLWADDVAPFADANALLDLRDLCQRNGVKESDYIPGYWAMLNYRGGLWALPSTPASLAMHVNAALVPKKYSSPSTFPQTFEALDDLADSLNKKDKTGRLVLAGFIPSEPGWWHWAWGSWFGGSLMDGDELTINAPLNVKGFEWVSRFGKKVGTEAMQSFQSGFGNFASPQDAFMSGKIASELHGVYKANYIRVYQPNMKWFALPFPHPASRPELANRTILGQDVLMIPRGAKHPDAAFQFIHYVQRQDVMESLCMRHGKNSPLEKVSQNFLTHHPNPFISLFDSLARSKGAYYAPKVGILSQISDEMNNVFAEVNLGQKTPKQALDEAQARLNSQWQVYKSQVLNQ